MGNDLFEKVSLMDEVQRICFYESLAHSLTISIRSVWSDNDLSDKEKVDRMKWINEISHRVINRIVDLRYEHSAWSDLDMWEEIKHNVKQHEGIKGEVAAALKLSLQRVLEFEKKRSSE